MSDLEERNEVDLVQDWLGIEETPTEQNPPTYEEKVSYLKRHLSLDGTEIPGEDLLTLVSLVNAFVAKARVKTPNMPVTKVLLALLGDQKNSFSPFLIERVGLMCEIFLTPKSKFRTFGLESKEAVINEIKRILDSWVPF